MANNNLCTIYIVRHGQSQQNERAAKGLREVNNNLPFGSDLTDLGEKQARELSKKLNNIQFDAAFSSDLTRAKRTAEIILKDRKLEVITKEIIRERNWGSEARKDLEAVKNKIKELQQELSDQGKMQVTVSDVESEAGAVSRLLTFLREIAIAYGNKNVLVVGHGNVMRMLLIHLGWCSYDESIPGSIKNTGYIVLESDGVDFFIKETYMIDKKVYAEE